MTGPGKDDSYADKRDDYQKNEVAVDYNSGFTGAHSTSETNRHMITHTSFSIYVVSSTADLDHTIQGDTQMGFAGKQVLQVMGKLLCNGMSWGGCHCACAASSAWQLASGMLALM